LASLILEIRILKKNKRIAYAEKSEKERTKKIKKHMR
jgi:hypothetical protein